MSQPPKPAPSAPGKYLAAYGKVDLSRGETFETGAAQIDAVLGPALTISQQSGQLVVLYFDVDARTAPAETGINLGNDLLGYITRCYPRVAWTLSVASPGAGARRQSNNFPGDLA